ncbi:MAG: outer membrane lipoprotein carrier protein LolA [Aquificae bacterium]|nr:outer membrane lipoprotein carrier protein LolA [Aquificota bacterium]
MVKKIFLTLLLIFSLSKANSFEEFIEKAKKHKGVYIEFTQISLIEGFDQQTFEGKAFILKDKKIKIEYTSPQKQYILIEGEKSITYIPSENQVIITKLDQDLALIDIFKLLSGALELEKIFSIKAEKDKYILLPKNPKIKEIKKIVIHFKDKKPHEIKLYDTENNVVIIKIKKIKYLDSEPNLDINYPIDVEIITY